MLLVYDRPTSARHALVHRFFVRLLTRRGRWLRPHAIGRVSSSSPGNSSDGFSSLVRARSIRAPRQTEQENPRLVGGDLPGGSYEIDQQLLFRPAPDLCRYWTPLRGLYVVGAPIHRAARCTG